MNRFFVLITVKAVLAFANGHVAYSRTGNHLHPVQGLYVKPSMDGTTGDLYVAATEESGSKTQWLTEQPVHFLPMQSQHLIPTSYNHEELNQHKRAVVNAPMQYAYALPGGINSETNAVPYPYALPTASSPSLTTESKTEAPAAAMIPQYNPYQYFYPQMLSAYTNMMSILKDAGLNEETASSVVSQASPMWSQSYAYPYQYVMVDPSVWAQAQTTASPAAVPSTTSSPTATEKES